MAEGTRNPLQRPARTLGLALLLAAPWTFAKQLPQCEAVFGGGVQGFTSSSKLDIDEKADIIGAGTSLNFAEIEQDDSHACYTGRCTPSGSISLAGPDISIGTGGNDFKLDEKKSASLSPGVYKSIETDEKSRLTLNAGVYRITNKLEIGEKAELIIANGPVLLLVKGEAEFKEKSHINYNGQPNDLLIYVEGDLDIDEKALSYANHYVSQKLELDEKARIYGTVSVGQELEMDEKSQINVIQSTYPTYDDFCLGADAQESLHHYAISHSGTGVTCAAETITFIAHDANDQPVAPGSDTTLTINTSTGQGNWSLVDGSGSFANFGNGTANYTFANDETQLQLALAYTQPATVNINVSDANVTEQEDPNLVFSDAGFVFYADGTASAIGPQISGKGSDMAPGSQALFLRAVKTNTQSGACEARLQGAQNVAIGFSCENPNTCQPGAALEINGDNDGNVQLNFDSSGYAPLALSYNHAGQIRLSARTDLPAQGADPAVTLTGNSNTFTVRPAGLCIDFPASTADCAALNASCTPLARAGEVFTQRIRAMAWDGSSETGPQLCDNPVAANFAAANIDLNSALIKPVAGVSGRLSQMQSDISSGSSRQVDQSLDEVGIFKFTTPAVNYFDTQVPASESLPQRITPYEFAVSEADNGSLANACGSFTYIGQLENDLVTGALGYASQPVVRIEAHNRAGAVTENYIGDFMRLLATGVEMQPPVQDADQLGVDGLNKLLIEANLHTGSLAAVAGEPGVLEYTLAANDDFYYLKNTNARVEPFNAAIALAVNAVTDQDNVADNASLPVLQPDGVELRYGRLVLANAYGPETQSLPVPISAEYWLDGRMQRNSADACTSYSSVSLNLGPYTDDLSSGEVSASGTGTLLAGEGAGLILSAPPAATPGDTNQGSVELLYNAPSWLMDDWDNDGSLEDPAAVATFGRYRGNDRVIYWKEEN